MKTVYRVLAYAVAVGVVLQAAFIAFAMFGVIADVESGRVVDLNYEGNAGGFLHALNGGLIIPLVALVLLIVSFFARVPGGVTWAAAVFGLVFLQVTLGFTAFAEPFVGLLHGANALAVFTAAVWTGRRVSTRRSSSADADHLARPIVEPVGEPVEAP